MSTPSNATLHTLALTGDAGRLATFSAQYNAVGDAMLAACCAVGWVAARRTAMAVMVAADIYGHDTRLERVLATGYPFAP